MTGSPEAFGSAHGLVNEMALTNAEAIPGIHFDRQDADEGFD
jgi:hypothetical protein